MSRGNRQLIATLVASLLGAVALVGLASLARTPPGQVVIARVEGVPIHAAEFEVGLLSRDSPRGRHNLDAPLIEKHGEDVWALANLVVDRASRIAWERLLAPGHFVIETDFFTMTPDEAVAERRAILAGNEASSGVGQRIRAELEAVGDEAYWGIVIPNQVEDTHARVAFTRMRGFEGHYGSLELARIALTLDIEVARSFSDRVSEAELRAYLEDLLEVMPPIIDAFYAGTR